MFNRSMSSGSALCSVPKTYAALLPVRVVGARQLIGSACPVVLTLPAANIYRSNLPLPKSEPIVTPELVSQPAVLHSGLHASLCLLPRNTGAIDGIGLPAEMQCEAQVTNTRMTIWDASAYSTRRRTHDDEVIKCRCAATGDGLAAGQAADA